MLGKVKPNKGGKKPDPLRKQTQIPKDAGETI